MGRASLDRVLSKTAEASLRSYKWGSYNQSFTLGRMLGWAPGGVGPGQVLGKLLEWEGILMNGAWIVS